jgi:hypothetical protein
MLEAKYPLTVADAGTSCTSARLKRFAVLPSLGGGFGAALCTVTMLLPLILGAAGAGASVACSMPGMCPGGSGLTGPLADFVGGVTRIGPPLLVASIA